MADRPAVADDDRARALRRRLSPGGRVSPTLGLAALVAGAISISLGVVASKEAFAQGAGPHDVVFTRLVLGGLFALPFLAWALRAGGRSVGWRPLAIGAATGAALCLSVRSELEGLARLPAGTLTVLLGTLPIWVTAVAWLGFGRVPTALERLAIVTVVVGVAVMALPVGAAIDPLGVAFGILSALCFTSFLAMIERNRAVPAAASFLLGMVGAGVLLLVVTPGTAAGLADSELSAALILAIGATTAIWAVLVGFGLQATDSVTAAIVVGVEPVLVAVLAFVLLGEDLSARELVGGLILMAALAATTLQVARDASASASQGPAATRGGIPEAPGAVQGEPDGAGQPGLGP